MSSTNKTTNYNLSQFVGTDVPSYLGDYNGDMSKIDKAIGDVANSQGSVEQSVVGLSAEVQGLSTQVSGVSTSVQQVQTSVAQIDTAYKQADTALSQRITANANNIQTNTTAIEGINTTIGTEDISGIGDGTIKGAIGNLNSSLTPKNIFSGNFIELSQYITETLQTFEAPYSGWYYMSINTGENSITPFMRLGIENKYVYSESGITGTYKYMTSPLIYITKGTRMYAQCESGTKALSSLYCYKDE